MNIFQCGFQFLTGILIFQLMLFNSLRTVMAQEGDSDKVIMDVVQSDNKTNSKESAAELGAIIKVSESDDDNQESKSESNNIESVERVNFFSFDPNRISPDYNLAPDKTEKPNKNGKGASTEKIPPKCTCPTSTATPPPTTATEQGSTKPSTNNTVIITTTTTPKSSSEATSTGNGKDHDHDHTETSSNYPTTDRPEVVTESHNVSTTETPGQAEKPDVSEEGEGDDGTESEMSSTPSPTFSTTAPAGVTDTVTSEENATLTSTSTSTPWPTSTTTTSSISNETESTVSVTTTEGSIVQNETETSKEFETTTKVWISENVMSNGTGRIQNNTYYLSPTPWPPDPDGLFKRWLMGGL